MLRILRTRLILAFVVVNFLALFLAGLTFVYILRGYHSQLRANQLADMALPLSYQVAILEWANAPSDEIIRFLEYQANELDVRILLMDSERRVLVDTGNKLEGHQMGMTERPFRAGVTSYWADYKEGEHGNLFVITSVPRSVRSTLKGSHNSDPGLQVALTVPHESLSTAWLELAPGLSIAALVSLIVSIGAAVFLSRSITRPIGTLTSASEEIARSRYDHQVPRQDIVEIDSLAQAFNRMTREVSQSQQSMRDFLANVSHELRTPLTSIQGFAQAMIDGTLNKPEDYKTAGQVVQEESSRMHRLVDDLLYLSKIESGQVSLNVEPVSVGEIAEGCTRAFERQSVERDLKLSADVEQGLVIQADPHRLEQVLTNMIDNAVKHTPTGGEIQVKASSSGSQAQLSVTNSGSYIPPEHLSRIFERFYQIDRSRMRAGSEGSGLGLSIVKELVQLHNGSIEAKSDEKTGTVFTVSLPAWAT